MVHTNLAIAPIGASAEAGLVAAAQSGNREAYLELVRHHNRPPYRMAYAMTRNQEDAAALVRDAFLHAWDAIAQYPTGRRFFPWLLQFARKLPLTAARPNPTGNGDSGVDAFDSLRQEERIALALRAVERLRYEEISVLLDVTIGVVILRISQARGQMLARAGTP